MRTARECKEDALRLLDENTAERARLPRWRWLKRKRLASEWMSIAVYHQAMWGIVLEEERNHQ